MKLKNILSILCVFFVAISCSMEDDILNEVGPTRPIEDEVSGEAYIAIKTLLSSGAETKSLQDKGELGATEAEAKITSCSLILLNGNTVQSVADGVFVDKDNVIVKTASPDAAGDTVKFMVKVNQANYRLMVVANSNTTFTDCATLSDVEAKIQSDNVDDLVKVGINDVTFPDGFKGYASTVESSQHPVMTTVTLKQLTARIELLGFNVSFINDTKPVNIVVTKVEVQNLNNNSRTGSEYLQDAAAEFTSSAKDYKANVFTAAEGVTTNSYTFGEEGNEDIQSFYSYRNNSTKSPLQMRIHYTADKVEKTTQWITINEGSPVQNGYIYRLIVNAKVTSDEFDCAIQFSTKPWVKHSMSVDMNEKTN